MGDRHYHPVPGMHYGARDPNPYTLGQITDPAEWPDTGDVLWLDHGGVVLLTDVVVKDVHGQRLVWEGLLCQGPVGDGVAWGANPHQWIAVEGTIEPGELFRIYRRPEIPRLPTTGDLVTYTLQPPYRTLHVAEYSGPRERAALEPGCTLWTIDGPTTDHDGQQQGVTSMDLILRRRPWDD